MLTTGQVLAFVPVSIALLVIPGPSVLFVITRGVAHGRAAALATVAGNSLGLCVHTTAVALGVGAIVERSLVVFTVMKVVGAAYLLFLGVKAIRGRRSLGEALGTVAAPKSTRTLVRDGFLVGITNPKTTLFFLAILPQFVERSHGHVPLQLLALGMVFVVLAVINDGLYGIAAGSVRGWLDRSPRRAERIGGASGLVMIGLGVRLALTGRRD